MIVFAESLVFESRLFRRHPHAYQFLMSVSRVLRQQHLSLLFQLVQPHADFLHIKSLHQSFNFAMHSPFFLLFESRVHKAEEFFLGSFFLVCCIYGLVCFCSFFLNVIWFFLISRIIVDGYLLVVVNIKHFFNIHVTIKIHFYICHNLFAYMNLFIVVNVVKFFEIYFSFGLNSQFLFQTIHFLIECTVVLFVGTHQRD